MAFFSARDGLLVGGTAADRSGSALVWRTSDGGASWAVERLPAPTLTSVSTVGSADAWAAAGCGPFDVGATCSGGVFASKDGGRTWTKVSDAALDSVSFVDAEHGWAVGIGPSPTAGPPGGAVYRTSDGGRTWTRLAGDPCHGYGRLVALSYTDRLHGWLGCGAVAGAGNSFAKAVVATSDGGSSWHVVAGVVAPVAGAAPSVGSIDLFDYLDGIVMRPDGAGVIWQSRGTDLRTGDGGRTWQQTPPGSFDAVLPASFALLDDRTWFTILWDGNVGAQAVQVSHDGGRTWVTTGAVAQPTP